MTPEQAHETKEAHGGMAASAILTSAGVFTVGELLNNTLIMGVGYLLGVAGVGHLCASILPANEENQ